MTKLEVTRPGCPSPVECRGCQRRARCTGHGAQAGGTGQHPTHSAQRHTHTTPPVIRNMQQQPITHGWGPARRTLTHRQRAARWRRTQPGHARGPAHKGCNTAAPHRRGGRWGPQDVVPCSRPPTHPHLRGAWAWVAANPVVVWSVPLHTSQPPVLAAQGKQPPDHPTLPLPARRPAGQQAVAVLLLQQLAAGLMLKDCTKQRLTWAGEGRLHAPARQPRPRLRIGGGQGAARQPHGCPPSPHRSCTVWEVTKHAQMLSQPQHQRRTSTADSRQEAATSCPGPCPRTPDHQPPPPGRQQAQDQRPAPPPSPRASRPTPANASCHALPLYTTTPTAACGQRRPPSATPCVKTAARAAAGAPRRAAPGRRRRSQLLSWTC